MLTQWHNIHLIFPDKQVLDGVSLTLNPGDRIGLVGENGAGKTCLFRILLGQLTPSQGRVHLAQGVRIGYLTQHLIDTDSNTKGQTCWEVAASPFSLVVELERQLEHYTTALSDAAEDDVAHLLEQLGTAQVRFEQLGGYTYQARIQATLQGLGLSEELWELPVAKLSAGQKVRLALARLLLSEYDLLLLDEPTNHLDVEAREWLQERLRSLDIAYIVVSHDRRFLDAVVDKVAWLDRGKLTIYTGNYSDFRHQLEERTAHAWQVYEKRQKTVRKLEQQARNYETWSHRTEKTKRGAWDKGYIGHKAAKLMKRSLQAQQRLEQTIEAMKTDKPHVKDAVTIDFHASEARNLVMVRELTVGYETKRPFVSDLTLTLRAEDRVALVGPNGCGKSTLIKAVLGQMLPLAGEVWRSPAVNVGYFDQDARQISPDTKALEAVLRAEPDETLVRTVMGRMRIRRESVTKSVGSLSAGERAKVLLARLILGRHNLLVLDEPTNHLDIETQDVLLEALSQYPGGILFVSHDRHFVDTLATQVLKM